MLVHVVLFCARSALFLHVSHFSVWLWSLHMNFYVKMNVWFWLADAKRGKIIFQQKLCIRLLLILCYTITWSSNQSSQFSFNRSRSGMDSFLSVPVFDPVRSFSTPAFKKKSVQIKRIGPGPVIGLRILGHSTLCIMTNCANVLRFVLFILFTNRKYA